MAALPSTNTITADGTYDIPVISTQPHILELSGTFGSGTVTVKNDAGTTFKDSSGSDVAYTAAGGISLQTGRGTISLVVTGSTTPAILVSLVPVA